MGARRPAFALILVLLLVASVFAMTVHSAVVMRASLVETSAVAAQHADQRAAQSASSILLRSIAKANGPGSTRGRDSDSSSGSGSGSNPEEDLDLPPIVRQLLAAAGHDIEKEAEKELDGPGGIVDGVGTSDEPSPEERAGDGRLTLPGGGLALEIDGRVVTVRVLDAQGGLNLNTVEEPELRRYFELKGLRGTVLSSAVDQILDWRDEDSVPRRYGMEREGYRRMGMVARDGDFRAIEELRALPAIDEALFASIRMDLCLGGDGRVHLGSASPEVLQAVGELTPAQVEGVLNARRAGMDADSALEELVESMGDGAERLRVHSSPVVRILATVRVSTGAEREFEGTAVISGGEIASFGMHLRPWLGGGERYDGSE